VKRLLLTMCLLATLAGAGRAESAPEAPASPPLPPEASQQSERKAEVQELEDEVRQVDPTGRLTAGQLFQLLQQRELRRADEAVDPTAIVVPVSFFSCALTGFLAWLLASHRKARQLHETVRLMVEKGAEIPQALLAPPARKPSDLRRGIILSTAGLGLALFLAVLPDVSGAWGAGLTLFCIGVGHLISWRLQQGKGTLPSALAPGTQP
jgi:hypothetical protein